MSETKLQMFEEWHTALYAAIPGILRDTNAKELRREGWNAAQAALRAEMEQLSSCGKHPKRFWVDKCGYYCDETVGHVDHNEYCSMCRVNELKRERAEVVAAAEEAFALELLGGHDTLCWVDNWTEEGDYDLGDVVADKAHPVHKHGPEQRTALACTLDQTRADRDALVLVKGLCLQLTDLKAAFATCAKLAGNDEEFIAIRLQKAATVHMAAERWLAEAESMETSALQE